MTLGSSGTGPWTSEIASVTTRPAAAPSCPPLIAERCFLHAVQAVDRDPGLHEQCGSWLILSASVSPAAGSASSADAPPESSTSSVSIAADASGPAPARAARRRRSRRWDPGGRRRTTRNRGSGQIADLRPGDHAGDDGGRAARANAAAIGHAALPAATTMSDRRRQRRERGVCGRRLEQTRAGAIASSAPRKIRSRSERRLESGTVSDAASGRASRTGRSPR